MNSFLTDILMPDELPSGDRAVYVFLEMIALGFVLYAVEEGFNSSASWTKVSIAVILASLIYLLAINWTRLKQKLWPSLVKQIDLVTSDYRFRYGVPLLLLGGAAVWGISYLHSLRLDLDMYVTPRVLSTEQATELNKALLAHPSDTTVKIFTNSTDQESTDYGGQLLNAIRSGGWDADFEPINPWDSVTPSIFAGTKITKAYVMSMRGVGIESCLIGQPTNPDPKHPTPGQMLSDAFKSAQIEVQQHGESTDCGQYSLALVVGRRPMGTDWKPPLLVRLGNWLSGR